MAGETILGDARIKLTVDRGDVGKLIEDMKKAARDAGKAVEAATSKPAAKTTGQRERDGIKAGTEEERKRSGDETAADRRGQDGRVAGRLVDTFRARRMVEDMQNKTAAAAAAVPGLGAAVAGAGVVAGFMEWIAPQLTNWFAKQFPESDVAKTIDENAKILADKIAALEAVKDTIGASASDAKSVFMAQQLLGGTSENFGAMASAVFQVNLEQAKLKKSFERNAMLAVFESIPKAVAQMTGK